MQRSLMADLGFHQSLLEVSEDRGRLQLYCYKHGNRYSASITAPGRGEETHEALPASNELQAGAPEPCPTLTSSRDASTWCPAPGGQSWGRGAGPIPSSSKSQHQRGPRAPLASLCFDVLPRCTAGISLYF